MPRACETIIEQISLRREKNPEISFELNLSMIGLFFFYELIFFNLIIL